MTKCTFSIVLFLLPSCIVAQSFDTPLDLKLAKISDPLYAHLPQLTKPQGLLIEAVNPQSPAWRGGLRPFDIITAVNSHPLVEAKSLEKTMAALTAGQSANLSILRAGQEMVLVFDAQRRQNAPERAYLTTKGLPKSGAPPAVTIQLQTMDNGSLKLTLKFYSDNSGKLEQLTYSGQLDDIEQQIQAHALETRFPEHIHDLVDVAFRRARDLNRNQK